MLPVAILLAIALTAGCTTPDQWRLWQPGARAAPAPDRSATVAIPANLQPRLAQPPTGITPTDGPLALSVEQAAMMALTNNRDLRVQQFAPVIAGTFEQIERGGYDPEAFASLTFDRERTSETSRSTGGLFDVDGREAEAAVGIRQQLPSGTSLEVTLDNARSISNRAPEQQSARLGLSVTQALLRGYGPAVNLISVRRAELDTTASIHELRGFTEAVLGETEIAYWNYVLARERIAIFESSLALSRQQMHEIEKRIEVGLLPEAEAAAAHAQAAVQEQALIDARSQLEARRLRLLRLVDPDPEGALDHAVVASSDPRIDPEPIRDLQDRLRLAAQSRADLAEARLRLEQQRLDIVLTRDGLLPKLELFLTLGKTGYADAFAGAFEDMDGETYDAAVGLRLTRSLGRRAAQARDLAARATRSQALQALANLQQIVRLDVRLAVNELERTRQQISASRATRRFQEQTLAAEQQRFDVGVSTSLLVAQAQRDLLASRIAEIEAVGAYRIALVRLYLAEGSLLARRGVVMAQGGMK